MAKKTSAEKSRTILYRNASDNTRQIAKGNENRRDNIPASPIPARSTASKARDMLIDNLAKRQVEREQEREEERERLRKAISQPQEQRTRQTTQPAATSNTKSNTYLRGAANRENVSRRKSEEAYTASQIQLNIPFENVIARDYQEYGRTADALKKQTEDVQTQIRDVERAMRSVPRYSEDYDKLYEEHDKLLQMNESAKRIQEFHKEANRWQGNPQTEEQQKRQRQVDLALNQTRLDQLTKEDQDLINSAVLNPGDLSADLVYNLTRKNWAERKALEQQINYGKMAAAADTIEYDDQAKFDQIIETDKQLAATAQGMGEYYGTDSQTQSMIADRQKLEDEMKKKYGDEVYQSAYTVRERNYNRIAAAQAADEARNADGLAVAGMSLAARALNLGSMFDAPAVLSSMIKNIPIDANAMQVTQIKQLYDSAVANKAEEIPVVGPVASKLYQFSMSVIDNVTRMTTGAMYGDVTVGKIFSLGMASMSVGMSAAREATERGASSDAALMTGTAASIFEALLESQGIEAILSGSLKKGAFVEMGQEMLTSMADFASDWLINGGQSEYGAKIQEYMRQGYSRKDATAKANWDIAKEVAVEGMAGLFTGAILGKLQDFVNTRSTSQQNFTINEEDGRPSDPRFPELDNCKTEQDIRDVLRKYANMHPDQGGSAADFADLTDLCQRLKAYLDTGAEKDTGVYRNEQTTQDNASNTLEALGLPDNQASNAIDQPINSSLEAGSEANATGAGTSEPVTELSIEEIDRQKEAIGETMDELLADNPQDPRIQELETKYWQLEEQRERLELSQQTSGTQSDTMSGAEIATNDERRETNGREEGALSTRNSEERNVQMGAAVESGGVAGESEQIRGRGSEADKARSAAARSAEIQARGIQKESTAEAVRIDGIGTATKGQTAEVPEDVWSKLTGADELNEINDRAKANGVRLHMMTGAMEVDSQGKPMKVDGLISGDDIYVQIDSKEKTGGQIYDHEDLHWVLDNSTSTKEQRWDAIDRMVSAVLTSDEGIDLLDDLEAQLKIYYGEDADFYDADGNLDEDLWYYEAEELLANANGRIDIAKGGIESKPAKYSDVVRKSLDEQRANIRRGPPAETEQILKKVEQHKPLTAEEEVKASRALDSTLAEDAEKKNEQLGFVDPKTLQKAIDQRKQVKKFLDKVSQYLPDDETGKTVLDNGSYGKTYEPTTICTRTLATEGLMDAVSKKLGRPLTVEECIYVAQAAWDYLGNLGECTYCYVAMDRKARREYRGRYIQQRDQVLDWLKDGMKVSEAQQKYAKEILGRSKGNKTTNARVSRWAKILKSGGEFVTPSMVTSDETIQKNLENPAVAEELDDLIRYAQSASYAKKYIGYTAYNGEILKMDQALVDKLNSYFGLRMYSFSDYHPAFLLENMQVITDAAVRGLKVLAYTKDIDFARIFEPTGANINISIFAQQTADKNGNFIEDAMQGAEWEAARAVRAESIKNGTGVGIVMVATSNEQVEWALAQDWIDVVIPFHMVKTGGQVADAFHWTNYTKFQEDVKGKSWKDKTWKETHNKSITPPMHQNNKQMYLAALEANDLTPRFAQWIDNPNYMKLVNETRRADGDTSTVQPIFNLEGAEEHIQSLAKGRDYYRPVGGTKENEDVIADEVTDEIKAGAKGPKYRSSRAVDAGALGEYRDGLDDVYDLLSKVEPFDLEYEQVVDGLGSLEESIDQVYDELLEENVSEDEINRVKQVAHWLDEAYRDSKVKSDEIIAAIAREEDAKAGKNDVRFSREADDNEQRIYELDEQLADLRDRRELADGNEYKVLSNEIVKLQHELDTLHAEERKEAVKTSLSTILENLDNYRRLDLISLGNQLTDSAWDGLEEMKADDIRQGIREIIEEREYSPLEMQTKSKGLYVRPVDQDIRYSRAVDSEGNQLTEKQAEYFADSKVRDKDGNLKVVYHGTPRGDFTVFDPAKIGTSTDYGWYGRGFYFTDRERVAKYYAGYLNSSRVMTGYLNITNPYELRKSKTDSLKDVMEDIMGERFNTAQEAAEAFSDWLRDEGYDGLIAEDQYMIFDSNQFKRIDNTAPTNNPDTRFSRDTDEDLVSVNRKLRNQIDTIRKQRDYWRAQTHRSIPSATQQSANKMAKAWKEQTGSTMTQKDIAAKFKELGDWLRSGSSDITILEARNRSRAIAKELLDTAKVLREDFDRQAYAGIKKSLMKAMTISPQDASNIPDYEDWRKSVFGKVNIRKGTSGYMVDQAYQQLNEEYPDWFPADITNPADQLLHMADVYESIQPIYENPYDRDYDEALNYAETALLEDAITMETTEPTYADRKEAEIDTLRRKANEKLTETRQKHAEEIAELKERYKQAAAEKRARQQESNDVTRLLKIARRLRNRKMPAVTRAVLDRYIGGLDLVAKSITGASIAKLEALRDYYDEQKKGPDFIPNPYIEAKIDRLYKKQASELTALEVADLTDILLNIEHELRTKDKFIKSELAKSTYAAGQQVIADVENTKGKGKTEKLITGMLSPERLARRVTGYREGDPLYQVFRELSKGANNQQAYQYAAERQFTNWTHDKKFTENFAGPKAQEISLDMIGMPDVVITPAMRASLWLHSLNPDNLRHITYGGVTIPDMKLYRKGKIQEAYDAGKTIKLKPSQVRAITSQMTATEKAYAQAASKYFNETSHNAINEVSEAKDGFSIANVENYFPIDTDKTFLKSEIEELKRDGTIEGMGFTKQRIHATNPIMLYDMDTVLNRSISQHAKYVGLAIPVRNFNKLWTVGTYIDDQAPNSVQKAIISKWGRDSYDYITKVLTDIQSPTSTKDDISKILGGVRSKYAQAVLELNASVAIKQSASYPTAAAVLGWKPLLKAMGNIGKVNLDTVYKYSPMQAYREKGFASQELGEITSRKGKTPAVLNWIQFMDAETTRKLWKASEYYVRDNFPNLKVGSEEYLQKVGEIHTKVLEETQPNYTVMQRPQFLRSDSDLTKTLMMFKTQPFQNFNILYDATEDLKAKYRAYKNGGSKADYKTASKTFAKAVSSQLVASFVFAMMQYAWDRFRKKDDKYKNDEGDYSIFSQAKGIGINMLGNGFGMLPFGSEILEQIETRVDKILQRFGADAFFDARAYGLSDSIVEQINNTVKAVNSINDELLKIGSDDFDWKESLKTTKDAMLTLAQFAGVPAKNVNNLIQAAKDNIDAIVNGEDPESFQYKQKTATKYVHKLPEWKELDEKQKTKVDREITKYAQDTGSNAAAEYVVKNKPVPEGLRDTDAGKITTAKDSPVDANEYFNFRVMLWMVDRPTDSGTVGSFNQSETMQALQKAALSDRERRYIWNYYYPKTDYDKFKSSDKHKEWLKGQ